MILAINVKDTGVLALLRDMERLDLLSVEPGNVSIAPDALSFRTGFLAGQVSVPADFDAMGQEEIAALFGENL
jgi:hypothetical protein